MLLEKCKRPHPTTTDPHPNDHSDLEDAEGHVLSDHELNEIHVERKGDKYEHTRASGT